MKAIKHVSVLKIKTNFLVLPTKLQIMGAVRMPLDNSTAPVKDVFAVENPKGTKSDPSRLPKAAKTPISIAKEAKRIIKFELFASCVSESLKFIGLCFLVAMYEGGSFGPSQIKTKNKTVITVTTMFWEKTKFLNFCWLSPS